MVKIEWDVKLGFGDVLIRPKRSQLRSRKDVELLRPYKFLHSSRSWTGIPIVSANMDTTGTFEMAIEFAKHKCMVAIHKHYTMSEWDTFIAEQEKADNTSMFEYIAISSGTSNSDFDKLCEILNKHSKHLNFICLDIANGYSEHFAHFITKVRKAFSDHIIMAGNVVTQEMTEQLLLSGADIVKVGIGPGSVCTTRKKTGVGYPQLSAVLECADAAHGLGGLIVSDGGCTMPGDFGKAFGAGADFVMAGGMFSGFKQSGGDTVINKNTGKMYKQFYGMSSSVAMQKHNNKQINNYRASEGKCVLVPYKGDVNDFIMTLLGGLRSTCTYVGAKSLKELSKRTTFIRVNLHHNVVFGDEKDDNKKKDLVKYDANDETLQLDDQKVNNNDGDGDSNNKEKEALLLFLNHSLNKESGSNDNNKNDANGKDLVDMMSSNLKKEFFAYVQKMQKQEKEHK